MSATTQTLANDHIRVPQVRLIDQQGANQGVINTRDALAQARQAGLDLVAINSQTSPMIVKIVDLNKFLYQQKREEKERARKSRESEIVLKEVQLRPVTDDHDIGIKAKNARGFLDDNCRVKVVIKFRGREMAFANLGFEVMQRFLSAVGEHRVEREPVLMGRSITVMLLPPARP